MPPKDGRCSGGCGARSCVSINFSFVMILGLVLIIAASTSLYPVLIKLAFDSFASGPSGAGEPLLNNLRGWLASVTGGGSRTDRTSLPCWW